MAFEDSQTMNDGDDAINASTRRFMAKGTGGKGVTSKGFVGGGKEQGFVNTPIQNMKKGGKGMKGGKSY